MNVGVEGEANVLRYFGRLIGIFDCASVSVDDTTKIDCFLTGLEKLSSKQAASKTATVTSGNFDRCVSISDALAVSLSQKGVNVQSTK